MKLEQGMYEYVMRNCDKDIKNKDDIIEYLVRQCFYIDLHNDELQEKLDRILDIIKSQSYVIKDDDLPF